MKPGAKEKSAKRPIVKFGGRSTSVGVGYEALIAASIASKMLAGDDSIVWDGINGEDIVAISMQDAEPVDDIVVSLRGMHHPKVFISAKHRVGTIAMTSKSPAFTEVVSSFVRQFCQLEAPQRAECRLMWGVPSSVGTGMTRYLREALNAFREDAGSNISDFLRRRSVKEKEALKVLLSQAKLHWKAVAQKTPDAMDLCEFLRLTHVEVYDFGLGLHHERNAEETIRRSLAVKPSDSKKIWEKLELHFNRADRKGLRTTAAALRMALSSEKFKLKPSSGFAEDVECLRRLTERNLKQLEDHTLLRFSRDDVHISRTEELIAMTAAVKQGHLLVTGEPGCGKSGLIHRLSEILINEGTPVVLLLAEEVFDADPAAAASLSGLAHALDDVLAHWPDGAKGVLITDALDAVRDVDTQRVLRGILQGVQRGGSEWTVVASVREFDLKFGRELREAFPGEGVSGHSSKEFAGVSHFHVTRLAEVRLDELAEKVPEIAPFIRNARKNPRAADIHRSPFFLRLAADLLKNGISATRLADWSSPAILLRRFWKTRILDGAGASHRKVALQSIGRKMVELRSMNLSIQELSLQASDLEAIDDLRGRGILQSPILRHGNTVGEDHLRFSHHVLHDYAIARSLIPAVAERFSEYAASAPLMAVFYRQSFMFALEELWDGPDGPEGFWTCALKMEGVVQLHGITRTLAPILAAKRANNFTDLRPLFEAVETAKNENSPAQKALRHMASGLQDADDSAVRSSATAWCTFTAKLGELLPGSPSLETPLVHMLARLNAQCSSFGASELAELNLAARKVLGNHIAKGVAKGWRYAALTAIETLCRTFRDAPTETEASLLSLMTPARLAELPCWDLFDFAHSLKHLCREADGVVLRLFEAVFSTEPNPGEWENFGGAIMAMRMQSSDNWKSIQFSLAEYYATRDGSAPSLMTDIACIAWNAAMRRRNEHRNSVGTVIATFRFRGLKCDLIEDRGHSWDRKYEHHENRILSHFEVLLEEWGSKGNMKALGTALDRLATRNRTSLMWTVFMEAAAKHPTTLGRWLEPTLIETLFFTHPDYSYGGILLFSALHKAGDSEQRKRLEKIIPDLPKTARFLRDEPREPTPNWLIHAQNKLLGSIEAANIVLPEIQALRKQRAESESLPKNQKREQGRFTFRPSYRDETSADQSIEGRDSVKADLFLLIEELKPFREQDSDRYTADMLEKNWSVIEKAENALRRYRFPYGEVVDEVWGHLVGACGKIAHHATWAKTNKRWKTVRRILLKASNDPHPENSDEDDEDTKEDRWPSWGWPAPRLDAAEGLLLLAYRLGQADTNVKKALIKLCRDKSHPIRFNMGDRIAVLEKASPPLMWRLFDSFIRYERKFSTLETIVMSLERLIGKFPKEVKLRLARIAKRASNDAPAEHHIHERLAHAYLFDFLRTGDAECGFYIDTLVGDCDKPVAQNAIGAQLYSCREGGWLTAGDAVKIDEYLETVRKRTWIFFGQLLRAVQTKLRFYQEQWRQIHIAGCAEDAKIKPVKEAIDCTSQLVDQIAMQLYFASGAYADKRNEVEDRLQEPQKKRFWAESADIYRALAQEIHPHTIHQVVETLYHLLPCAPADVFFVAMNAIISSSTAGYQHESIAVTDVVKIIQCALADHRDIFKSTNGESVCLSTMLQVLDIFVEAGWQQARQLTHRLEEIYR